QPGKNELQAFIHAECRLGINLGVLIQVSVSKRPLDAKWNCNRTHNRLIVTVEVDRLILIGVLENLWAVVGTAQSGREPAFVVGGAEIACAWRLTLQCGPIGSQGNSESRRVCVAIVGGKTKTVEQSG